MLLFWCSGLCVFNSVVRLVVSVCVCVLGVVSSIVVICGCVFSVSMWWLSVVIVLLLDSVFSCCSSLCVVFIGLVGGGLRKCRLLLF